MSNNKIAQVLALANAIIGGVLMSGGAITLFAGHFGQDYTVSLVLLGIGTLQLVVANIAHNILTVQSIPGVVPPPAAPVVVNVSHITPTAPDPVVIPPAAPAAPVPVNTSPIAPAPMVAPEAPARLVRDDHIGSS